METTGAAEPKDSVSFELSQPRSRIIQTFEERISNHKFNLLASELSSDYIHYANFKIENERITVRQYRASPIYIYVDDMPGGKSTLRVEQENSVRRTTIFTAIFAAIVFVLVFIYIVGDVSIGSALLIALVPSLGLMLFFLSIFFLKELIRKNYFNRFANKIARSLVVASS